MRVLHTSSLMWCFFLSLLASVFAAQQTADEPVPTLVLAMLACEEEGLLRRHLPEWQSLADAFVIGIDSKTRDNSESAAQEVLVPKPVRTYRFEFEGFGPAKSALLSEVYSSFPSFNYVLLVEPDMVPVSTTFDRTVLHARELVYSIRRSGKESRGSRLADCLLRNDGNWYYKFRVHETPVYRPPHGGSGVPSMITDTGWTVVEIEGSVRDTKSRKIKLQDELRLVELDLKDFPSHPRLLYYAGVLRYELAAEIFEASRASHSEASNLLMQKVEKLARKAVRLLERRARDPGDKASGKSSMEHEQQRTAAAYYCARTHIDFLGNAQRAEYWYRRAIALEPDFLYAHVALIHLLFKSKRYVDALNVALQAEQAGQPRMRLFMGSEPLYACDMPLLLSKAIYFHYSTPTLQPNLIVSSVWKRRSKVLEKCFRGCPNHAGDTKENKMNDIRQLQQFWKAELQK